MDFLECVYTIKTKFQPLVQWYFRFLCNEPVSHFDILRNGRITFRRKIILEIFLHHTLDNVKLTCTGRWPALRYLKFGCNEP